MKNIKIIISSFYPKIGGAERQLQIIAKALIEKGYNVEVITRRYKSLAKTEYLENIKITRIKIVRANKVTEKVSFYINTILYLLINSKVKPDIIIASQTGVAAAIATFIKKVLKCKVLVRIAGGEIKKFEVNKEQFKKRFKDVDKFMILNDDMKRTMKLLDENRVVKITNSVMKPKSVNEKIGNYILFCGRIEEVKGIRLLLDSWVEMQKVNFEIPLVIVGDGSLKVELQNKYKSLRNIKWVGEVQNTKEYYMNARLVINTSQYEGISNTILEALSYGVPVIASNVGGNIDLIHNYNHGVLFERKKEEIISVICDLYFNDKKLLEMKKSALKYIENHYIENIISQYIKEFD